MGQVWGKYAIYMTSGGITPVAPSSSFRKTNYYRYNLLLLWVSSFGRDPKNVDLASASSCVILLDYNQYSTDVFTIITQVFSIDRYAIAHSGDLVGRPGMLTASREQYLD